MRRTDNSSFKNYNFDLEKYQEDNKVEVDTNYVKPVDTSVAGLLARGVVPNTDLNYSTDIPPMDSMNLMDFHKLKQKAKDNVSHYEELEKQEREFEEKRKSEELVEVKSEKE